MECQFQNDRNQRMEETGKGQQIALEVPTSIRDKTRVVSITAVASLIGGILYIHIYNINIY